MLNSEENFNYFKGALSQYFGITLQCRNMFLHQWKPKNNERMQFCYLGLYHYTETIYCWLLRMARMEMN